MKHLLIGIIFAALWASASVATKWGIRNADPLILATVRFLIAGLLILSYVYLLSKNRPRLPQGKEWKQLALFAFLNTTLYLGAFVLSMREVAAGIGSLSSATGPLFVLIILAIGFKKRLKWYETLGVCLGFSGAALATWPLLQDSHATTRGLLILLTGIVSVSLASVYYARVQWKLPNLAINGWQVLMGGLMLLPFAIIFGDWTHTKWDSTFWLSAGWLIVPVSLIAMNLWLYLLQEDVLRASVWLFLCPIFGFTYAYLLLDEPLSWHTFAGTVLVIAGLYLAQLEKFTSSKS